jgi:hypothetical protein
VMLYDDMPARHMAASEKSVRALWQVPAAYLLLGSSLSAAYLAIQVAGVSAPAASWCEPAGGSPAQVRGSARLVASVAWPLATVVTKRTHSDWMGCGIEPRKIRYRRGREFLLARRQHVRHRYARC